MNNDVFSIEKFNIIQDEENYYFFRALNMLDNNDLENGVTTDENGKVVKVLSGREHYTGNLHKLDESGVTLEEVYHQTKSTNNWKDTNCISLSTNANISITYGRGHYKDRYVMIKGPKKDMNKKVFMAGPYMIDETNKRIENAINTFSDDMLKYYIDSITHANNQDDIEKIKKQLIGEVKDNTGKYKKGWDYLDKSIVSPPNHALNKSQNLEKAKTIAKLDILGRNVMKYIDNSQLVRTIGSTFSNIELLHYGTIEQDELVDISKEVVDAFSILQQLSSNSEVVEQMKKVLLKKVLNNEVNFTTFNYNDSFIDDIDYNIETMYELTQGNFDYKRAKSIYKQSYYLAKSKLRSRNIINDLESIYVDYPEYQKILEENKDNLYGIEPELTSRINSTDNYSVSDSVHFEFGSKDMSLFNYLNGLIDEELEVILKNPKVSLQKILTYFAEYQNQNIDRETYYATALIDSFDFEKNLGIINLTSEQRQELIDRVKQNNCVSIYNDIRAHGVFDEEKIAKVLLYKVVNDSDDIDLDAIITQEELETYMGYYEMEDLGITLRPDQARIEQKIHELLNEKQFASAILPTGYGKSYIALSVMEDFKDKDILFLSPNDEINTQLTSLIAEKLHGKQYSLGKKDWPMAKEVFPGLNMATYSGLTDNHLDIREKKYDLIIWDELHRTGAKVWEKRIGQVLQNQDENTKILSLTATPKRDSDRRDMSDEWALRYGYTEEEINSHKHLAANLTLEDAIREGLAVNPRIVNCDYNLKTSDILKSTKERIDALKDEAKKEELIKTYNKIMHDLDKVDGMDKIFNDNIKPNGKYIVFVPVYNEKGERFEDDEGYQDSNRLSSKEVIDKYQNLVMDYLKDSISREDVEFHSMLGAYSESRNAKELKDFEKNKNGKTQFLFVMNKLNEGKHVDKVDGMIWFRPLDKNSYTLYRQQMGRVIRSKSPNEVLNDDDRPVVIDAANNTLRVTMCSEDKIKVSDVDKLNEIINWIDFYHKIDLPDINSKDKTEANYGMTLKRIQREYLQYIDNDELLKTEIYKREEIETILLLGSKLDLWTTDLPERGIKNNKEDDLLNDEFSLVQVTGISRDLYDLTKEIEQIERKKVIDKLHEYRLKVEELDRIIKNPKKDKHLKFTDGANMVYYFYDSYNNILKFAAEGNEDAKVILKIANKQEESKFDRLHEYRLKVEELGRLVSQSREDKQLIFSDKTKMSRYWVYYQDEILKLAAEGNEDAKVIVEIANKQEEKKIDKLHEYRKLFEKYGKIVNSKNKNSQLKFSDGSNVNYYLSNNLKNIKMLAAKGNEDAIAILKLLNNKINKLHEYRLKVEELGRLVNKTKEDQQLKFSDNSSMVGYWRYYQDKILKLAAEGNEDAKVILEIANKQEENKIDKVHEYRLKVEELGRLVNYSKEDQQLKFSDGSNMNDYWKKYMYEIDILAAEGNEDAKVILEIANRQEENKIDKVHEYRLKVEKLSRLVNYSKEDQQLLFSDETKMSGYWKYYHEEILKLAAEGNEDAKVIVDIANKQEENKIDKVHEYRLKVEELGRLVNKSMDDKQLTFSDNSSMVYYWNFMKDKLCQLAAKGNEDAKVIVEIANKQEENKIDKVHEYRLKVEELGRLVNKSMDDKQLTFSDNSSMVYYWNSKKDKLSQLAAEGNEDAKVIVDIANKQEENKIDKLHEYRLKVEELGRLPKYRENLKFSDDTLINNYWNSKKDKLSQLAAEGNEDAKVIVDIANKQEENKINKLHEYRLKVEELGRLVSQSKEDKKLKFENNELMVSYWSYYQNEILKLAVEGNEDAKVIVDIANKQEENKIDKLHEYRLKVEELGRLIRQSNEDKMLKFSDGSFMSSYFKANKQKQLLELAAEGNEDAKVIVDIANKQEENKIDKLHEYRLKVEEFGRLIKENKFDKEIKFSDGSSMSKYWYHHKDDIEIKAREDNNDAIIILSIANKIDATKRKKPIDVHNLKMIEKTDKNKIA